MNGNMQAKKRMRCSMNIKRGDILLVNLEPVKGSEQGKVRPCLVIQNDVGNKNSPTTIVAAITSKTGYNYPFTIFVKKEESGLDKDSTVLGNQIRTISINHRTISRISKLKSNVMEKVDEALKVSLGL
jgi:mRNA interferase MazF